MAQSYDLYERYTEAWSKDSIRLFCTPSSFAKSTYFYVQECGHFKTNDIYYTERQNLKSFLLLYTLAGEGILDYQGNTYRLKQGDCFYINCMEKHKYYTAKGHPWEFLWIHFDGPVALGYYEQFVQNEFQIVHEHGESTIVDYFHQILTINQEKALHTEILSSHILVSILTELVIRSMSNKIDYTFLPDSIKQVITDIDRNFKSELTLDGLARKHGMSKFHLARKFKEHIGITVNEYIICSRISCAKDLLKYTHLPINEIANTVGIHDPSHFINLFKARESLTPSAYRKKWK